MTEMPFLMTVMKLFIGSYGLNTNTQDLMSAENTKKEKNLKKKRNRTKTINSPTDL